MNIAPTYKVLVDWTGDGTPDYDITEYVQEMEWGYGRDYASELTGRSTSGTCRIRLLNADGRFSPMNAASPYYGKMLPGRKVYIETTYISTKAQWTGYLDSLMPLPSPHFQHRAELRAIGPLGYIAGKRCSVEMQTGITTGAAIGLVLDAIGWAAADRQIDTGQTTMSRWWVSDKTDALTALREIEETEAGFLRETKDGKIAFEDRLHRLEAPHSTTYTTWSDETDQLIRYAEIVEEDPLREIFNVFTIDCRSYNLTDEQVLWIAADVNGGFGGAPPAVDAGETITLYAVYPTPGSPSNYPGVNEWSRIDYEANTASDNTGTDVTSNISITQTSYGTRLKLVVTNSGGSKAYLTLLQAYGYAVVEGDTVQVEDRDTTSIAAYGERTYQYPARWISNVEEAKYFAAHFKDVYKDPRQILRITLRANTSRWILTEALSIDLSDRILVNATSKTGLYISTYFYVERVTHRYSLDSSHTTTIECSLVSDHRWENVSFPWTPNTIPSSSNVPGELEVSGFANYLHCYFNCIARKYNDNITLAEFRAAYFSGPSQFGEVDLRTVSEGGTLYHNGTTMYVVRNLDASPEGAQYDVVSASQGRWYYAFRLKNRAGWSTWTDGNAQPAHVRDYVDTEPEPTDGPPEDWGIAVEPGIPEHTVVVRVSRPAIHGQRILGWVVQLKDSSQGAWRAIDAATGAAVTYYNGAGTAHTLSENNTRVSRASGSGFGAANVGDLCLFDVRGGDFDHKHCQWAGVTSFQGNDPTTATYFNITGRFRPYNTSSDYRIKIVKGPWLWTTEGYLGNEPNAGLYQEWFPPRFGLQGDTTTETFITPPITIPESLDVANVQARAWFENVYSRSDDDTYSGGGSPKRGCIKLTITDGHVSTNAALGHVFLVDVDQNFTLDNPTNVPHCGYPICWIFNITGAGGWTVTLDTAFALGTDVSSVVLTTTASKQDWLGVIYYAATTKFHAVSFVRGYA